MCRSLERDTYSIKSKREVHFTAIRLAYELYILGRKSAETLLMFAGETESSGLCDSIIVKEKTKETLHVA